MYHWNVINVIDEYHVACINALFAIFFIVYLIKSRKLNSKMCCVLLHMIFIVIKSGFKGILSRYILGGHDIYSLLEFLCTLV